MCGRVESPTISIRYVRTWRDAIPTLRSDSVGCLLVAREEESALMNLNSCSAGQARRGWSLTQADVLLCALPIVLFLSIVSLV
jgi:hypothetical protein